MTQKKKTPNKKAAPAKKAAPKKKPIQKKLAEIPQPTQQEVKELQVVVEELKDVRDAIAKISFFRRLTKWFRS
jgi:hypothetical protein